VAGAVGRAGVPVAHGLGTRADLPLPLVYVVIGGGLAVLVSFLALGVLWRRPRLTGSAAGRPLPAWLARVVDGRRPRLVAGATVLLVASFAVVVALVGPRTIEGNFVPWAFYITFWVGLVPASLLLGPVWAVANPLRVLYRALERLVGPPTTDHDRRLRRCGYWPAVGLLAAFAWLELVAPHRSDPYVVALVLIGYAAAQVAAATVFGERWFATGDVFEVYSRLLGRLAIVGRRGDGVLVWRSPLNGADSQPQGPGLAAFAVVLVGSTAHDGLTRTRWWQEGPGLGEAGPLTGSVGLAASVAVVAALYTTGTAVGGRLGGFGAGLSLFAHTLLPIAAGYAVAHYFSLLVIDGQTTYILASDPFGTGANLLGATAKTVDYTVVSPRTISLVQVGAIVVAHIVGVVLAHDRAVRLQAQDPARTHAVLSQVPLLAVMVALTLGGLTLLLGG
jgi:hypothetical protein